MSPCPAEVNGGFWSLAALELAKARSFEQWPACGLAVRAAFKGHLLRRCSSSRRGLICPWVTCGRSCFIPRHLGAHSCSMNARSNSLGSRMAPWAICRTKIFERCPAKSFINGFINGQIELHLHRAAIFYDFLLLLEPRLSRFGLGELPDRFEGGFDAVQDWSRVLSLGEQQRLAAARCLTTPLEAKDVS